MKYEKIQTGNSMHSKNKSTKKKKEYFTKESKTLKKNQPEKSGNEACN